MVMTATALRKDIFNILDNTVKYNDVVSVTTKNGVAVILSEDDYRGLMETLYLYSQPGLVESILEASKQPAETCIPDEEVEW